MVAVKPIGSSSSGNAYVLESGDATLLLECGLPWKKIQKALNYKTSDLSGCLVTHLHSDHCKAARDVVKAGIELYTSKETIGYLGLKGHRVNPVRAGHQFKVGPWKIFPFETEHDCVGSLGFHITIGSSKILFVTDTWYIKYVFTDLTHIMVECNFCEDILTNNIESGALSEILAERVRESHMSLEKVVDMLRATDLSSLQEIYLLHLSNHNADEQLIRETIQAVSGVPVIICDE